MLIFDGFRVLARTFHALFGERKLKPAPNPVREKLVARTGLFSNPTSAGMITGAVSAGINVIPLTCWKVDFFNHPVLTLISSTVTVYVLCAGPYLVSLSSRTLKGLLRFSVLITLLFSTPSILTYGLRILFVYRHFALLQVLGRVIATVLVGRRLAWSYRTSSAKCVWLALLGNSPMLCFDLFVTWHWEKGDFGALNWSRDQLAFYLTAFIISQVAIATLPAWAAEVELHKQLSAPPAPSPPPATTPPVPAPVQE